MNSTQTKNEADAKELTTKVQQLDRALQKATKDVQDLQKSNDKLNSSLIAKQKDYAKLSDGIVEYCIIKSFRHEEMSA